jgi:RHS repeat-associated protein
VTVVAASSTGVRLTETDSYVVGQEKWRTNIKIANTSGSAKSLLLYRAFDCYRADSDVGYGYADVASGAVACKSRRSAPTPLLEIAPLSRDSHFYEAFYDQVWAKIGAQQPFDDTCRCSEHIDNGAGLSWGLHLAAGASATRSERIKISLGTPVGNRVTASETYGGGRTDGNNTQCNQTIAPVNCATGNFWHTFTDLNIPGRGLPLHLTRTYNSLAAAHDSPFGFGWSSSYTMHLSVDANTGTVTVHQENGSTNTFIPDGSGGYTAPPRVFATLTHNANGPYTFTRLARQVFTFDSSGQLIKERGLNGETTTLSYAQNDQLASITDAAGRTLHFHHNTTGQIDQVTDPAGRSVRYAYSNGNLMKVTGVAGRVWKFDYDGGHLLTGMTDPRGGSTANVYDPTGKVTSQTDPLGRTTKFAYTGDNLSNSGGSTTITDPRGSKTIEHYVAGELAQLTKAAGSPAEANWSFDYDQSTLGVTRVTDPNGHTASRTYDSHGDMTSVTDPLGNKTTYTYNNLREPLKITDPTGTTTTYTYDSHGNLTSISTPLGGTSSAQTTTLTYTDAHHPGDLTARTDPNKHTSHYTYDSQGDLVSSTDPEGSTTTATYGVFGRRKTMVNPKGNKHGADPSDFTTTYRYDTAGELTKLVDPLGHTTSYAYDANGNRTAVTDANGHTTSYAYDADNERTAAKNPAGAVRKWNYDAAGSMISYTDGNGHKTSYTYDKQDRLTSATDALGRTMTYAYDLAGNKTSKKDADGRTTSYAYDADNRLTGITYSDGSTPNVTMAYDTDGRRTSLTDGTGTSSFSYDALGRLTSQANGAGLTTDYSYDLASNLTAITYPNGKKVSRSFDNDNRLASISDWLGNKTTFGYDANSNLTSESLPNSITSETSYNKADQLTSITDTAGSSPLASFTYTRDNLGQVVSATETGALSATHHYTYDANERLGKEDNTTYAYDPADNPTSYINNRQQTFDAADQLTSSSTGGGSAPPPPPSGGGGTPPPPPPPPPSGGGGTPPGGSGGSHGVGLCRLAGPNRYVTAATIATDTFSTAGTVILASGSSAHLVDALAASYLAAQQHGGAPILLGRINRMPQATINALKALKAKNVVIVGGKASVSGNVADQLRTDGYTVSRIAGHDRFATDLAVASHSGNTVGTAKNGKRYAIVADGANTHLIDSLAASPVAYGQKAPIFLVNGPAGRLSKAALHQLNSENIDTVLVVGGSGAVGYQVYEQLRANGQHTKKLAGHDRSATSKAVADYSVPTFGYSVKHMNVASGNQAHLVDSLTGGPHAGAERAPILITKGNGKPGGASAFAAEHKTTEGDHSHVFGGRAALHDATAEEIEADGGNPSPAPPAACGSANSHSTTTTQQASSTSSPGAASYSRTLARPVTAALVNPSIAHAPAATRSRASKAASTVDKTYTYDAEGNRAKVTAGNTTTSYSYDQANRLIAVTGGINYSYDGDGLRMSKTVGPTTTKFAWDRSGDLSLLLKDGNIYYVHGPNGLSIEQITGGNATFLLHDQQDSTRLLTDSTGKVVGTYSYDAWGSTTDHTGNATTNLQYDGQYIDAETGFQYLRARYYDPATGQFITVDPVYRATLEHYNYSADNPLNLADPSGLFCIFGHDSSGRCRGHGIPDFFFGSNPQPNAGPRSHGDSFCESIFQDPFKLDPSFPLELP